MIYNNGVFVGSGQYTIHYYRNYEKIEEPVFIIKGRLTALYVNNEAEKTGPYT